MMKIDSIKSELNIEWEWVKVTSADNSDTTRSITI